MVKLHHPPVINSLPWFYRFCHGLRGDFWGWPRCHGFTANRRTRQVPGACDRVLRLLDDTFRRSHPASEGRNGDAKSQVASPWRSLFMAIKTGHFFWDLNGLMEMMMMEMMMIYGIYDWWWFMYLFMGFKWIDGNALMEMMMIYGIYDWWWFMYLLEG